MKQSNPLMNSRVDEFMTTREAAEQLHVSVRTVQLWVEKGVLSAWKTAGGHRRIDPESVRKLVGGDNQKEGKKRRVLLVEDERTQRKLLVRTLAHMGLSLDVYEAEDGYRGLLMVGQLEPDLVITDLMMPGMDGFKMLQAIKDAKMACSPGLIILSGLDRHTLKEKGVSDMHNTVLHKPVDYEVLKQAVKEKLSVVGTGPQSLSQ